jgi:predicted DNA-binding protein
MGHDIYAYKEFKETIDEFGELDYYADDEISYKRYCMGNIKAIELYDALDANEYNNGVSGNGKAKAYTINEIETAINNCKINDYYSAIDFFETIHSEMKKYKLDKIYIHFA